LTVYITEPPTAAQAVVIWMHGLGADAGDMSGLAEQLNLPQVAVRHVFMNAPLRAVTLNNGMLMPAWYDIVGLELIDRQDKEGIEESKLQICQVMEEQYAAGFKPQQVYLAGFSQGGAMAMYTALTTATRLGGVIALSGYLPLADRLQPQLDLSTPFFLGSGQYDPIVLPKWVKMSADWLLEKKYVHLTQHQYPMEHSVCMDEIRDLSVWLSQRVAENR